MTYESGGVSSVVDYVLTRKKNVKVIPGEECVSQHKLVVMDMRITRTRKKKVKGMRGRLKTWMLRSATEKEEFKCEVEKIMVHGESTQEMEFFDTRSQECSRESMWTDEREKET